MAESTLNSTTCEALSQVHSTQFSVVHLSYHNIPVPYEQSVSAVLTQFPMVGLLMGVLMILALLVRVGRSWSSKGLRILATTGWLVFSGLTISLASSYWLVPKLAEGLWHYKKTVWIEPGLSGINEVASAITKTIDLKPIKRWSGFLHQVYDNHTSRLLLHHHQMPAHQESLELFDTITHRPHIHQRLASNNDPLTSDEQAQLAILAMTAQKLAEQAFAANKLEFALHIAMQGYEIDKRADYFERVVLPIRGQMAHQLLQSKNYAQAVQYVLDMPGNWHDKAYLQLLEAVQYGLMTAKLSGQYSRRWSDAIEHSESLQSHYFSASNGLRSPHISCNIAFLHGLQAIESLREKDSQTALASLQKAKLYVPDTRYVRELMPVAYHGIGTDHMTQQRYRLAARSFESANALAPREDYSCDAAMAWRLSAFSVVDAGNFGEARKRAQKAKQLCAKPLADKDLQLEIAFRQALEHMQFGRWNAARTLFYSLTSELKTSQSARYYLSDIDHAVARHNKIINSRHMLPIPRVTGQFCTHFFEREGQVSCKEVTLYNGKQAVGRSLKNKTTDVIFNQKKGYLAVYDNFGSVQYDTWENQQGGSIHQWIDTDGDYRPDYKQSFVEDRLVESRQLSGRVSMRFVGGLINKKYVDIFSRPDTFLVAYKNSHYFGRTETADNSTRPRWRNYFVFDYKYGDTIDILALDEDLFSNELIDRKQFQSLPATGYVEMNQHNVTLAIEVSSSDRPEGRYKGESGQSVFDAPSFLAEYTPLSAQVKATYKEDARAQIMSTVAAIAVPEAGIFTLMKRGRFAEQLIAGWLGFEATDHVLNKSVEDRHHNDWR